MFVNRVEQQLYTIGGGGAGKIYDLDDVVVGSATTNGTMLIYESSTQKWVGIASTAIGGAADELAAGCTGVDLTLSGDLNVTGDLVYDEQTSRNINITGIATLNQGITTNFNVSGVSTATTMHVGSATTWGENLVVTGNARVTGILTIGTGSITLDPTAKKIKGVDEIIIGTATTVAIKQDSRGEVIFQDKDGGQASVGIGTTVSINTSGIVTASQFIVGAGGTDLLSELGSKTSIGLAIALG